jgi:hypothetical protein
MEAMSSADCPNMPRQQEPITGSRVRLAARNLESGDLEDSTPSSHRETLEGRFQVSVTLRFEMALSGRARGPRRAVVGADLVKQYCDLALRKQKKELSCRIADIPLWTRCRVVL